MIMKNDAYHLISSHLVSSHLFLSLSSRPMEAAKVNYFNWS